MGPEGKSRLETYIWKSLDIVIKAIGIGEMARERNTAPKSHLLVAHRASPQDKMKLLLPFFFFFFRMLLMKHRKCA